MQADHNHSHSPPLCLSQGFAEVGTTHCMPSVNFPWTALQCSWFFLFHLSLESKIQTASFRPNFKCIYLLFFIDFWQKMQPPLQLRVNRKLNPWDSNLKWVEGKIQMQNTCPFCFPFLFLFFSISVLFSPSLISIFSCQPSYARQALRKAALSVWTLFPIVFS